MAKQAKQQTEQEQAQAEQLQAQPEPEAKPAPPPESRLWTAKGGGYSEFVEADSRELAVLLACAYTGLKEQDLVFAKTKPEALPPFGHPVIRGSVVKEPESSEPGSPVRERVQYERG